MKKIFVVVFLLFMLCSCETAKNPADDSELTVVATVFPAYDWVREVANNTDVKVLLIPSNGTDIHSYQPSAADIINISSCELFICSSGEEPAWYDDISIKNVINISRNDSRGHRDEHSWFSAKYAKEICETICRELSEIFPDKKDVFASNLSQYMSELDILHKNYSELSDFARKECIVVADRYPFIHLSDEYNLKYYSAFDGCSAESEVSFETIKMLSEKIHKFGITDIIVTENSDGKIADAVMRSLKKDNINILCLDSMQSVDEKELEKGISYIEIMNSNLEVLKEALD